MLPLVGDLRGTLVELDNGGQLVDLGVKAEGSLEAGRFLAEICLAGNLLADHVTEQAAEHLPADRHLQRAPRVVDQKAAPQLDDDRLLIDDDLLDELANELPAPISSISLRTWPQDFPDDIAVQRQVPYESRADAIMYRQVLAELAEARGWDVHLYVAKEVLGHAGAILGDKTDEVLECPRAALGPPWTKDHRVALAATIVAG